MDAHPLSAFAPFPVSCSPYPIPLLLDSQGLGPRRDPGPTPPPSLTLSSLVYTMLGGASPQAQTTWGMTFAELHSDLSCHPMCALRACALHPGPRVGEQLSHPSLTSESCTVQQETEGFTRTPVTGPGPGCTLYRTFLSWVYLLDLEMEQGLRQREPRLPSRNPSILEDAGTCLSANSESQKLALVSC